MDFDHRDASTKAFNLMAGRAMLMSTQRVLAEVAKCDIVCANCHRIRTQAARGRGPATPPGTSRYLDRKRGVWRTQASLLNRLRDVPCVDCGGRFPPSAMEFDHRDPSLKRDAVTRMIGRAGTQRILEEVAKCDIVCANCHRERTFVRRANASVRE